MDNYGIYILLSIQPNEKYHWALYVPTDRESGIHAHVANAFNPLTKRVWTLKHTEISKNTLSTTFDIVLALKVGDCSHWKKYIIFQGTVKDENMLENERKGEEEFTYRIYVRRVLKSLHDRRTIVCPDPKLVEGEAVQLAKEHLEAAQSGACFIVRKSKYSL